PSTNLSAIRTASCAGRGSASLAKLADVVAGLCQLLASERNTTVSLCPTPKYRLRRRSSNTVPVAVEHARTCDGSQYAFSVCMALPPGLPKLTLSPLRS